MVRAKSKLNKGRRGWKGAGDGLLMTEEEAAVTSALLIRNGMSFTVRPTKFKGTVLVRCLNGHIDALSQIYDLALEALETDLQGLSIQGAL